MGSSSGAGPLDFELAASSFDLSGAVRRQVRLYGGDFFAYYFQQALPVRGARGALLGRVLLGAVVLARLEEGLSALGLDELHAHLGRRLGSALLAGSPDAVGQSGDAALLEVLVHEGVNDGIVEAVEEADGLDNGHDHVEGDAVVFLLQVIWKREKKPDEEQN